MKNLVAIYSRLSEEDKNKLNEYDESQSIQNQKSMLISYAVSQGWEIYNIYSDDDYKGSDRNRPAFQQLMKDAENKKFNIVLCKSQARFTRELELVEKIIHGQFVEWGIRFVGYADNADTAIAGNKKARQINGLVNEWYLEDLSDNIRTVLTDQRKKGMHIGAFALYGYQKDPEQKGHLIIDEEAAEVVRMVFRLYADGMGKKNIARYLNEQGIPNPTEYKKRKGLPYRGVAMKYASMWKYFSISDMLQNEIYIGNMVQGKYRNPTYKSRSSKPVPKEEWIVVENTHEPIIDKDLWDKVQKMLSEKARPMCTGEVSIWANKVKCLYCGYGMRVIKNRDYRYFRCSSRYFDQISCPGGIIPQRFLEEAVIRELNTIIDSYFDEEEAKKKLAVRRRNELERKKLLKDKAEMQKRVYDLENAIKNTYFDKSRGLISEQEFLVFRQSFEQDVSFCRKEIENLEKHIENLERNQSKEESVESVLSAYRNIKELDRRVMDSLIDYVEVGRNDNKIHRTDLPPIVIHWKF